MTCPSKFVTNQNQSDCICNVAGIGVILDDSTNSCTCKNGYQEYISSLSGCSACPIGQYSNSKTNKTCKKCPSKFIANQDQDDCVCNITGRGVFWNSLKNIYTCKNGFQEDNLSISGCSPCPSGYYSNSSTSYKCIPCSSGSYTNNDQSNCICNDQSIGVYFDPDSRVCKCQKNYFGNPERPLQILLDLVLLALKISFQ